MTHRISQNIKANRLAIKTDISFVALIMTVQDKMQFSGLRRIYYLYLDEISSSLLTPDVVLFRWDLEG